MWPVILAAALVSLANLTLLALVTAGLVRYLLPVAPRAVNRAPFWGMVGVLGTALVVLLATSLTQIALWAVGFMCCGEFTDPEVAFYHSAVNFTTLGYGDIIMTGRWRLLGPLEAINGSLMLGLSAAILFAVMVRVSGVRSQDKGV